MQETNTIESHIGELCSFLFYKILNVRMIIVSQRSLSKTASSLRIKEVRAITKNPKGTAIKFSNGFSHATVRDLSKHYPRNFDKLCGRVGVGLDSFTLQSEQMKIIMNIIVIVTPMNFQRLLYLCVPLAAE